MAEAINAAPRRRRRRLQGVVVGDAMEKTVTVRVQRTVKHPRYKKYVRRHKKYKAHDETNQCGVGDKVELVESRPISKTKSWRVSKVLEKAQ